MKIVLSTHKYAPEMNVALVNGVKFPTPGLTKIKEVKRVYFERYPFRKIVVVKIYKDNTLVKTVGGIYTSFDILKKFLRKVREYYNTDVKFDIKLISKG